MKLLMLALAGAAGTLARYGVYELARRFAPHGFPYGTLAVNAIGCFLIGFVWSLASEKMAISEETRGILVIGFLGAFTTFSTFAFDSTELLRESHYGVAIANILLQVSLGLVLVLAGLKAGRFFF